MNCFAWSWQVAQGSCAAGASAAGAAGCVAGIGAGAGAGAGGWGGVAGGCCAAANPGDKPRTKRRASPPRVNDRFDIGILRSLPKDTPRGPCGPPRANLFLAGMDSIHSPVLARAVTGGASLGRRGAAGEGGGIEVGVRGGVPVVMAAEASRGGRTLRREVVARGVDRGDAGRQRRDVGGGVHVALGAVAAVAGEAHFVEVEGRAAETVDREVLCQLFA